MDTKVLDWGQPLEAVHKDGRVIPVKLIKTDIGDVESRRVSPDVDGWSWFTETGRSIIEPDLTIRNVTPKEFEWGPEIKVFEEKPWFIEAGTQYEYKTANCIGDCWHSWLKPDWTMVVAVRLKSDHPYYDNTQTHTYTVAPEDEAALNASCPTPTRTALEQRMEDLVRMVAGNNYASIDAQAEARAILAELEPADPDVKFAREHCALVANECMNSSNADAYLAGEYDQQQEMIMLVAALRGRALERGE